MPARGQNYAELSLHGREPEPVYAGLTNVQYQNVEEKTPSTYENVKNVNTTLEITQPI